MWLANICQNNYKADGLKCYILKKAKTYIANKEKTLQRLLEIEDYRTDKMLQGWVKKRIIESNEEDFQPIFASYEPKINT